MRHTLEDWLVAVEEELTAAAPPILACGALVPLTNTLAEVRSLAVHESQQGKGLGGHLVLQLVQMAPARLSADLRAHAARTFSSGWGSRWSTAGASAPRSGRRASTAPSFIAATRWR
ncbi:MAG: GNAT family N-acetyltransferase [Anaerolineales bacterium]|nr:GNAT family N-acetyltransferase [Anaerolineales bacterium]